MTELEKQLFDALKHISSAIERQLELIAERAPGQILDKRPVVQALRSHAQKANAAIAAAEAAPQPAQQPAFLQVYRAKLKSRKQMERDIPPGMRGWWFDVSAGCELRLRQATQSDVDRCTLADEASRNQDDYMCEIFERGSLVSKIAIEFMNAERNVFVAAPQPKEGGE
ncbi:hypothetical protein [Chromobacterium haemolyticum]|uniref:hypothetical protein n=1 Tax=Chromobacterium haemolyticum TaxID=394935 RepID=UPI00131631A3|nr:hypothetical protein [Chromobacterium haemolyticum]BBH13429.1 hypothetical protein CH06BL_26770 [Chromobacterium haemolyticum]